MNRYGHVFDHSALREDSLAKLIYARSVLPSNQASHVVSSLYGSPVLLSGLTLSQVLASHSGCVNSLSWSANGQYLLSGSDDADVCIWRYSTVQSQLAYKFKTGHTSNIFSAIWLDDCSRIVSCSRDKTIRVFDLNWSSSSHVDAHNPVVVHTCHTDSVKRLIWDQANPHRYLSCSQDGTVRQFDHRESDSCSTSHDLPSLSTTSCKHIIIDDSNFGINCISQNPQASSQIIIGGDSPYVRLYDRRFLHSASHDKTSCVATFKPNHDSISEHSQITGLAFHPNGKEFIASYSTSFVFAFDVLQDLIQGVENESEDKEHKGDNGQSIPSTRNIKKHPRESDNEDSQSNDSLSESKDTLSRDVHLPINVSSHTQQYIGHCNVHTIKDVFFVGPHGEFVASGSDDGCLFIWSFTAAKLVQVLYADSNVVNVICPHPHLPILAVSGIDSTVKLFEPLNVSGSYLQIDPLEALQISQRQSQDSNEASDNEYGSELGSSLANLPNVSQPYNICSKKADDPSPNTSSLICRVGHVIQLNETKRTRGQTLRFISARDLIVMLSSAQGADDEDTAPCYVQ